MMRERRRLTAGWQLALLAAVFFLPLLVASWLYFHGRAFAPSGRTDHGALLEPIANLEDLLPDSRLTALSGSKWLLVYVHEDSCGDPWRAPLYRLSRAAPAPGPEA